MSQVQMFQIGLIAAYMLFLLWIGMKAKGQVQSNTDYLMAGRQMGWLVIAAGVVGTNYSGAVMTNISSFSYQYGLGGIWFEVSAIIGFLVLALVYAKRVRLCGAFTISEFFEIKFGYTTRIIAAIFIIGGGISAAAAQFKAIGILCENMFGTSQLTGILVSWIVILAYTFMGGFWAANFTNVAQLIFCFVGFPAIAIWAVVNYGGFEALENPAIMPETVEGNMFNLTSAPIALVLTWVLQWMWVNSWTSQWYFQRAGAGRSLGEVKKGFLVTPLFLLIAALVPATIIGMFARVANPALESAESSLTMMMALAPPLLGGLAAVGIFAAAMSTVDGCAMGATTVIARDIYQRTINPNASSKKVVVMSRVISVVVLIVVLLMATALESAAQGLNFIFVFTTGTFAALVTALHWEKACKEAALISILVSGTVAVIWTFMGGAARFQGAWWSLMLGLVLMVGISLIVDKTGPWWGNTKGDVREEDRNEILEFMANRKASMADLIDVLTISSTRLRVTISDLVMKGEIVEVDYMTYVTAENSKGMEVFTKNKTKVKDGLMIFFALLSIAAFAFIWVVTA